MEIDKGRVIFVRDTLRTARWLAFGGCPPTGDMPRPLRQRLWENGITPGDDLVSFTGLGFSWYHEVDPVEPGVHVRVFVQWMDMGPEVQTHVLWPKHAGGVSRSLAVSEAIRLAVIRASLAESNLIRAVQMFGNIDIHHWGQACLDEAAVIHDAIEAIKSTDPRSAAFALKRGLQSDGGNGG